MIYFVALLIFILVYVIVKFFLDKVPSLVGVSEIIALVSGVLAALLYAGALR
jgi:hypothetical protein